MRYVGVAVVAELLVLGIFAAAAAAAEADTGDRIGIGDSSGDSAVAVVVADSYCSANKPVAAAAVVVVDPSTVAPKC